MSRAKFQIGDKVFLNERCPKNLEILKHHPRTIINTCYSLQHQATLYYLGDNHKGANNLTKPFRFIPFRSYELEPISKMPRQGRPRQKRQYHFHRAYTYNGKPIEQEIKQLDTITIDKPSEHYVLVKKNGQWIKGIM